MTIIVNSGSTLTITQPSGLTLTDDSTIAALGALNGAGTITGAFALINGGLIESTTGFSTLEIDSAAFTNSGVVMTAAGDTTLQFASSVAVSNFSNGTLTGGVWDVTNNSTLLFEPGVITDDDANIAFGSSAAGNASIFNSGSNGDQPILNTLTHIGTAGALSVDNQPWAVPGSVVVDGDLTLADTEFAAGGGVSVSPTGHIAGSSATIASPMILNGVLEVQGNGLTLSSSVSGTGTMAVDPSGLLVLGGTSTSVPTLVNYGTVWFGSPGAPGGTAVFGAVSGSDPEFDLYGATVTTAAWPALTIFRGGELIVGTAPGFVPTFNMFGDEDTLVIDNLIANTASMNATGLGGSSGTLTISEGSTTLASFLLTAPAPTVNNLGQGWNYGGAVFTATAGPDNNTTITVTGVFEPTTVCFAAGTRIATPEGQLAVERLAVGDRVLTHFAGERRVRWIGHRAIDCRGQPDPTAMFPVRVAAGAFGDGLPRRDLYLSPGHALFIDGVLIPVKCLLNDATIIQVPTDTVTYYHIELDEHDVVFAEGLAAESDLDTGNRPSFVNGGASLTLFPEFEAAAWETQGCAPLKIIGETVGRARELLAARAAGPVARLTPAA